ncbi:MAG: cellulose binding domain-containing protein [Actinomycetota bacterium]
MVDLNQALRPGHTPSPPSMTELAARADRRTRRRRATRATAATVTAVATVATLVTFGFDRSPDQVTVAIGPSTSSGADPAGGGGEQAFTTSITQPAGERSTTSDPGDGTTTADSSELPTSIDGSAPDLTSDEDNPSGNSPDPSDAAPADEAPVRPRPLTSPDLPATVTVTSTWESGYCFQIDLVNDGDRTTTWSLPIELDGTVATAWNTTVDEVPEDGATIFTGRTGYNTTIEPGELVTFGACVDTA